MAESLPKLSALVLGGTGAVGSDLVNVLALNESYSKIVMVVRKKLELNGKKYSKVEQTIVDFDKLEEHADEFKGFDVGYCCLGTTHAKSGTQGFIKVDRDYVVHSAKLAQLGGCKQFHLVSSTGANKDSWFLYPRTKGEAEYETSQLGFNRLCIYQPGLLLCDRQERRPLEKLSQIIFKSVDRWSKFSVPTNLVALAMMKNTFKNTNKTVEIIGNNDIITLSKT